ncbi:MAG TPA: hypothetical protein VD999_03970 [Vitreimonas sp.]|nr:hypothetical protein [Vitreimonas sp.]
MNATPRWFGIFLAIVLVIGLSMAGLMFIGFRELESGPSPVPQASLAPSINPIVPVFESPSPTPSGTPATPLDYTTWKLFRNGYALPLPPNWKNTSDSNGRAVFHPGDKVGSLTEISVTVLSDAKAPQGQQFTTQAEFDQWSAVQGDVQGAIQKIDNVTVDGQPGLMLLDTRGGEDQWLVIVWVRKDKNNLYLTFKGNQKYDVADASAIDYIVSKFTFTAPPMTGLEGKQ